MSQPIYGMPADVQALYGVPITPSIPSIIISLITAPIFIISSFIIGIILYLITHKKVFIFIPVIMGIFYIIVSFMGRIYGLSFN